MARELPVVFMAKLRENRECRKRGEPPRWSDDDLRKEIGPAPRPGSGGDGFMSGILGFFLGGLIFGDW